MSVFQYTTLVNAKLLLQIPQADTTQDTFVSLLIARLSAAIEKYCRRVFGPQQYTEIASGTGTSELALRQRPILAVSGVFLDPLAYFGDGSDAFDPATTQLQEGQQGGFAVEWDSGPTAGPSTSDNIPMSTSGLLLMISDVWPKSVGYAYGRLSPIYGPPQGNIKVNYTAGFMGTAWYSTTCTINGTNSMTNVAVPPAATPLQVGMVIVATGVPIGTYITAINGTTITMSQAATASGSTTVQFNIPAPYEVQMACDLLVAYTKNIGQWGAPVVSSSYDGASIAFDQAGRLGLFSEPVQQLLSAYVNQAVA